jgi:hypothetical protein
LVAGAFVFAAALSSSLPRRYLLVLVEDVCRRCFQLRYLSQSLDRIGRALHAMGDAFEQYNRLQSHSKHRLEHSNAASTRRVFYLISGQLAGGDNEAGKAVAVSAP